MEYRVELSLVHRLNAPFYGALRRRSQRCDAFIDTLQVELIKALNYLPLETRARFALLLSPPDRYGAE